MAKINDDGCNTRKFLLDFLFIVVVIIFEDQLTLFLLRSISS